MLNLSDRHLMALELAKSMLESPFYFDEETRRIGVEPEYLAKEAVAMADALMKQLAIQGVGSTTLKNEEGEVITVKPETVEEAKRLVVDGKMAEAAKLVEGDCGCTQKVAKEFCEKLEVPA